MLCAIAFKNERRRLSVWDGKKDLEIKRSQQIPKNFFMRKKIKSDQNRAEPRNESQDQQADHTGNDERDGLLHQRLDLLIAGTSCDEKVAAEGWCKQANGDVDHNNNPEVDRIYTKDL